MTRTDLVHAGNKELLPDPSCGFKYPRTEAISHCLDRSSGDSETCSEAAGTRIAVHLKCQRHRAEDYDAVPP